MYFFFFFYLLPVVLQSLVSKTSELLPDYIRLFFERPSSTGTCNKNAPDEVLFPFFTRARCIAAIRGRDQPSFEPAVSGEGERVNCNIHVYTVARSVSTQRGNGSVVGGGRESRITRTRLESLGRAGGG